MNISIRMPRHNYIGTQSRDSSKINSYFETVVKFDEILNHPKMDLIHKPNYQGSLIESKVEEMVLEYLKNPLLLKIKNKIIIGCLNQNWYIIDGQHRIEMAKILFKNHNIINTLNFCWFECKTESEMKELFVSLNHDSFKNKFYIETEDFEQVMNLELIQKLKDHCKTYFSKKKTEQGKRKTIEEFVENLRSNTSIFKDYDNSQEVYEFLMDKNKEFYNINRYDITYSNNIGIFYVDEQDCIRDKVIFSLKRNNFIEWLVDPKENPPFHYNKKSKSPISSYKKQIVWRNEYNDLNQGECPIPHCNNILRKGVKNGWECGHIISEFNRGETEPKNLRPICGECNRAMGSRNWQEWVDLF